MSSTFNPSSSHPMRAQQAWQILIAAAMNRQTYTYLGLSQVMYGRKAQGVLAAVLGHIAFYCIENKLPTLTSIVVGKGRGTPGQDIPADKERMDELREEAYEFDWYNIVPPTAAELAAAHSRHR